MDYLTAEQIIDYEQKNHAVAIYPQKHMVRIDGFKQFKISSGTLNIYNYYKKNSIFNKIKENKMKAYEQAMKNWGCTKEQAIKTLTDYGCDKDATVEDVTHIGSVADGINRADVYEWPGDNVYWIEAAGYPVIAGPDDENPTENPTFEEAKK